MNKEYKIVNEEIGQAPVFFSYVKRRINNEKNILT